MQMRFTLGLSCLALLTLSAACGQGDPSTYETPTVAPNVGEETDLTGTYAYKSVLTQCVEKSVGDGYDFQTVISYSVMQIDQNDEGTGGTFSAKTCWAELSEVSGSDVLLSDGYIEGLASHSYPFSLSAPKIGEKFTSDKQIELRGVEMDDPSGALPTDVDDPRVFDFDGDGNPGFTLMIRGLLDADLYTVERYEFALNGTIYSDTEISGHLDGSLEDSFLESTRPAAVPTDFIIYPVTEHEYNYFVLKEVDDGNFTCAKLANDYVDLFPEPVEEEAREGNPCE